MLEYHYYPPIFLFDELCILTILTKQMNVTSGVCYRLIGSRHILFKKISGYPKFHPQIIIFILETMVPWVKLEGVSAACANVSALPFTVKILTSHWEHFIPAFVPWKLPLA